MNPKDDEPSQLETNSAGLEALCLASILAVAVVVSKSQTVTTLTSDTLKNGPIELNKMGWKYHPSDLIGDGVGGRI